MALTRKDPVLDGDAMTALVRHPLVEPRTREMMTSLAVLIAKREQASSVTAGHVEEAARLVAEQAMPSRARPMRAAVTEADATEPETEFWEPVPAESRPGRLASRRFAGVAALVGAGLLVVAGGAWLTLAGDRPAARPQAAPVAAGAAEPAVPPQPSPPPHPTGPLPQMQPQMQPQMPAPEAAAAPEPSPDTAAPAETHFVPAVTSQPQSVPPSQPAPASPALPAPPPAAAPHGRVVVAGSHAHRHERDHDRETRSAERPPLPPPFVAPGEPAQAAPAASYDAMVAELRRAARTDGQVPPRPAPDAAPTVNPPKRYFGSYVMGPDGHRVFEANP